MNCPEGWRSPSVGYQNGCRCSQCQGWRDRMNVIRRMRAAALRAARARPKTEYPVWTPKSATSFYRDALDSIDAVSTWP